MHHPITDIQANFGINRPVRYQVAANEIIDTDGRTNRQTDVANDNNACEAYEYFFCNARIYSGNSARLNKTKIRWKGIIFRSLCCF